MTPPISKRTPNSGLPRYASSIVRPVDPALLRMEAKEMENHQSTAAAFARIGVTLRDTGSRVWSGYFKCTKSKDGRKILHVRRMRQGGMMIDALVDGGTNVHVDPDPSSDQRHFVVLGCDFFA